MDQSATVKKGYHHSTMNYEETEDTTIVIKVCNITGVELTADEAAKVEYQGRCRVEDLKSWEDELLKAMTSGASLEVR